MRPARRPVGHVVVRAGQPRQARRVVDVRRVGLPEVVDLRVHVPARVELVVPGEHRVLDVVPAPAAVVQAVHARVERVAPRVRGPHHAGGRRQLALALDPGTDVVAGVQRGLHLPVTVELDRGDDAVLRVGVDRVQQRVGIADVVRRELRLDVRNRDVAADADVHALGDLREPEVEVVHDRVEAVGAAAVEVLVAEHAVGERVLVVGAVQQRQAATPVEVVALHDVGRALEVERELVELHGVRLERIGGGRVAAAAGRVVVPGVRRAEVAARLEPAVDGQAAVLQGLAAPATIERVHHGAGIEVVDADRVRATDVPGRVGPRRIADRNLGAVDDTRRRCARFAAVPGEMGAVGVAQSLGEATVRRTRRAARGPFVGTRRGQRR